jgi:hypothetical protein
MCEFVSWIEDKDGKLWWLTDKVVEAYVAQHSGENVEIEWADYAGHSAIRKVLGVDGKHGEGFPCPAEIAKSIRAGELRKIARLGALVYVEVSAAGEIHGLRLEWWGDGKLYSESHYKAGKRDGICQVWYTNGRLHHEDTYKSGEWDGLCQTWHENGNLCYKHTYKDGKRDGLCQTWHHNGKPQYDETYKSGKLDDLWQSWNYSGKLLHKANYKDGVLIARRCV